MVVAAFTAITCDKWRSIYCCFPTAGPNIELLDLLGGKLNVNDPDEDSIFKISFREFEEESGFQHPIQHITNQSINFLLKQPKSYKLHHIIIYVAEILIPLIDTETLFPQNGTLEEISQWPVTWVFEYFLQHFYDILLH